MIPVYIAGPYAADTQEEIDENVRRACVLGRFAMRMGYAPIVVHPAIAAGAYGDDANPEDRKRGTNATLMLATIVARQFGGKIWVIRRDDGTISRGTEAEVLRFLGSVPRPAASGPPSLDSVGAALTWAKWQEHFARWNIAS